jgi:hypothetical protein
LFNFFKIFVCFMFICIAIAMLRLWSLCWSCLLFLFGCFVFSSSSGAGAGAGGDAGGDANVGLWWLMVDMLMADMADGRWQMADGRWQMAQMADGRWQMADGRW